MDSPENISRKILWVEAFSGENASVKNELPSLKRITFVKIELPCTINSPKILWVDAFSEASASVKNELPSLKMNYRR